MVSENGFTVNKKPLFKLISGKKVHYFDEMDTEVAVSWQSFIDNEGRPPVLPIFQWQWSP